MRYYPIIDRRPSCTDIQSQVDTYTGANSFTTNISEADAILVAGGDGFFLEKMREHRGERKPFFGIHCGTLGFLLNHITDIASLPSAVEDLNIISSGYLEVSCTDTDGTVHEHIAINDCVIGGNILDYFRMDITTPDRSTHTAGTGLIISTPIGSTGYSLNNSVPLLPLSSNLWSISGLATRPFHYRTISPSPITIDIASKSECIVGCDGYGQKINNVTKVSISPSSDQIQIAFCPHHDFQAKRIMMATEKLG